MTCKRAMRYIQIAQINNLKDTKLTLYTITTRMLPQHFKSDPHILLSQRLLIERVCDQYTSYPF